ncbi:MAG: DinB family protein [Nevskiales bacterium]
MNTSVVADFLDEVRQSRAYTLECAQAMPEDKYGFRPVLDTRTFGQQMAHIAESFPGLYELLIEGKTAPTHAFSEAGKEQVASKADVVRRLNEGFGYVERAALRLKSSSLEAIIQGVGGREVTKRRALRFLLDHTTHHRGQAVIYLRMNGVRPPPYRA